MKLPRDVSGAELVQALGKLGYVPTRQEGSHVRLTRAAPAEQHLTVPAHNPLRVGTLSSILRDVSQQTGVERDELLRMLF